MHELFHIANNLQTNITPIIGSISWSSNINELGDRLDFDIAFNDERYFPKNPVDLGSLIIVRNKDEIFRGITITENRDGRGAIGYTCFDYAFYLNKSKGIYQFNKLTCKQAIEIVLKDYNILIGNIAPMGTLISKIYNDKTISDIIRDILDIAEKETGIKHTMEMRQGKIYIEPRQNLTIKATFQLASNIAPADGTMAIGNPVRKRSIEDMKNSIIIISDEKVVAQVKNDNLIKLYGLLQEVESVDKKDVAQAKNIAQQMLKDLGRIFEENAIELPGDDKVRAGWVIEIEEPVTGMKGKYLIEDANHTIKNGIHMMQLGLGVA